MQFYFIMCTTDKKKQTQTSILPYLIGFNSEFCTARLRYKKNVKNVVHQERLKHKARQKNILPIIKIICNIISTKNKTVLCEVWAAASEKNKIITFIK